MPVPPIRLALVLACALACVASAPAGAAELTPSWGYAYIDDRPFQEPSGAFLPSTQAFPRGYIRDTVTDGKDVRLRVWAFSSTGRPLAHYDIDEGDFVNVPIDRRLDVAPSVIPYLRFDFCVFNSSGISCLPSHYIGRPDPPAPPPGGGGGTPPPPGVVDADRDGHQPPADCDDTNSMIHPGAPERAANGVDDDCAGGDMPGRVTGAIVNSWLVKGGRTVVRRLGVREAPAGAIAEVRCHGRALPVGAALEGDRRARRRPPHAVVQARAAGRDRARGAGDGAERDRQGRPLHAAPREAAARPPPLPAARRAAPGPC